MMALLYFRESMLLLHFQEYIIIKIINKNPQDFLTYMQCIIVYKKYKLEINIAKVTNIKPM